MRSTIILFNLANQHLKIKTDKLTKGSAQRRRPDINKIKQLGFTFNNESIIVKPWAM